MAILPNFSAYGYQISEQLNHNMQGGRITYKAVEIATQKPVVIKQFRFATDSGWDSYKEIEREIEVLQGLNHPGIPKYLAQFDPGDGLCLVQEYKNAQPLSKRRSFSPEEIKSIATQVLEILVYLQQERIPPIFHRDIKPENILVDNNIKVYLVDFGLAKVGNNTLAFSSMMGGTMGFMPPEQVHNQKLTEASDLYGLGATLICLITQTKSADIGSLVDFSSNRIVFKDKVPKFSLRFIQWLEKMVESNPANRYQNAEIALEELNPLYVFRVPEVNLENSDLNFVANKVGQQLSQTIIITNTIPDTILEGKWSVSPHPSDPPHTPDSHAWISFLPQQFKSNYDHFKVIIDTNKLKADRYYERKIVLNSNARQKKYYLKVKVKTAAIEANLPIPPYSLILVSSLVSAIISGVLSRGLLWILSESFIKLAQQNSLLIITRGAIVGAIVGVIFGAIIWAMIWAMIWLEKAIIWGIERDNSAIRRAILRADLAILRVIMRAMNTEEILQNKNNFYNKVLNDRTIAIYVILSIATGILTGVGSVIGFNSYLLTGLIASALPLTGMLIYTQFKLRQLKAQYRRQESQNLIEP